MSGVWAVVPVKELTGAKQRLSSCLTPEERRALATIMLEDVLDALSAVSQLAGILVVTLDPGATSLAGRYGARIVTEGAREGHTGAVTAGARLLVREGRAGMMTMPGDIPRVSSAEIAATLAAHRVRACVHHRAGARRSRVQHHRLFAARRRSAALRREQLLPPSQRGAGPRDRTARRPSAGDRHGHRPSGRSRRHFLRMSPLRANADPRLP